MELGNKIRQLRFKCGMTQEQLAERAGVTPQSVSKWENSVAMPDISLLPVLSEIFGVSIDEMFDLTSEQKLNRIENRMDVEEELSQDVFVEYEEYLKSLLNDVKQKQRATELLAYLYWHRMNSCSKKVSVYARDSIRNKPDEKVCQWMLQQAERHAAWDWNINNHNNAIEFYRELSENNPKSRLALYYLLDNLIADKRSDEAERALKKLESLENSDPIINGVYKAHIALARYDEKNADGIIESLLNEHPDESKCLFEAAQYYAGKSDLDKAIDLYERSFEKEQRRPRFTDELHSIALICRIKGDYKRAADTYGRIIDLLKNEWGFTEETELTDVEKMKASMLEKAK